MPPVLSVPRVASCDLSVPRDGTDPERTPAEVADPEGLLLRGTKKNKFHEYALQ